LTLFLVDIVSVYSNLTLFLVDLVSVTVYSNLTLFLVDIVSVTVYSNLTLFHRLKQKSSLYVEVCCTFKFFAAQNI